MTLGLFKEAGAAAESSPEPQVTFAARLLYRAWGAAIVLIAAIGTVYTASQVLNLFRSFTDASSVKAARILFNLNSFDTPLIVALGVAALLAFLLAIALAMDENRRLAAPGLLFSIAVPILAVTPALLLWFAERTTVDVVSGKQAGTPAEVAETITRFLFWALATGLGVQVVIVVWAMISLFIRKRTRTHPLSIRRVIPWAASGILLLVLAGAYFVMV